MSDGYSPDVFEDGPLIVAMREVRFHVEEINRIPEETLNVLITVMSEGELHVPRLGRIASAPGFRLVAAMNPFDAIGTARISSAVYDRVCRLSVTYQSATDEVAIVGRALGGAIPDPAWVAKIVELVRRTRTHPDLRSAHRCARHRRCGGRAGRSRICATATHPSECGTRRLVDGVVRLPGETARGRRPLDRGDHHRVVARGVRPAGRGWGRPGKTGAPTGAISSRS